MDQNGFTILSKDDTVYLKKGKASEMGNVRFMGLGSVGGLKSRGGHVIFRVGILTE